VVGCFCRKYDFNRKFFTFLLFRLQYSAQCFSSFCFHIPIFTLLLFGSQISAHFFSSFCFSHSKFSRFCFSVRNFQRIAFQVSTFHIPIFTLQLFRSQFSEQCFSSFCFTNSNFHASALKFYAQSNSYFLIIFNCVFSAQLTTNVLALCVVGE
jgi:hypothetical protein